MLTNRIIACLDVMDGRVVKGTGFVDLRDAGDPVVLAERYEAQGADEIVYLDIAATDEGRSTLLDLVRRTAGRLFIPLTVGGGMRTVDDIANALRAGADKTAVNSAAVRRPELLTEAARRFGSQCVVASIDAQRTGAGWEVRVNGGREPTGLDAIEWARQCAALGAGEILLTMAAVPAITSSWWRMYRAPSRCQSLHQAAQDPRVTLPMLLFLAVRTRRCSPAYCTTAPRTSGA